MKTHWRKLYNPDFLGAYSLDNGQGDYTSIVVTIESIRAEEVTGPEGKKTTESVCRFKERGVKPMILNATNNRTLEKLFKTPYVEEWLGRQIEIGVEKVRAFGEYTDALRIKKTLPRRQGPPRCQDCSVEITATEKMNVAQLVAFGEKRYGKALCENCLRKLIEPKIGQKEEGTGVPDGPKQEDQKQDATDMPNEPGISEFEKAMMEGAE